MQKLLQKEVILHTYPAHLKVLKRTADQKLTVQCEFDKGFLSKAKSLRVEVWTDLVGNKHTGFEMHRIKDTNVFFREFHLQDTGIFSVTFRYRQKEQKYWSWIGKDHEEYSEVHVDPGYINNSIVYNAFIRFYGHKKITEEGEIKYGNSGTFDDLKKRLNEIKKLGIDIIYLNPIHVIGELYRNYNPHDQFPNYLQPGCPYSIKDYKSVDPELGIDKDFSQGAHSSLSDPMQEFKEFVKEAHKRKIKVFMDLVFNHTSHDFVLQRLHPEWFLYKEDIQSRDSPYLYPEDLKKGLPWGDPAHTLCPFDHGYWWEDAAQLNWEYKIDKAQNNPPNNPTLKEMKQYFKSIPKYWIKHLGIDGFRCDVAYRVPPDFWRECIHEARDFAKNHGTSLSKDVVFIAETYCDDLNELFNAGFTAVYGDYGNKLFSPLTLKGYLDYMYNISGQFFPENSKFFVFPECHDFHRMPSRIGSDIKPASLESERINMSRWLITATIPGIPMIFNGFEKLEWKPINLFSYSSIDWEADKDLKDFITKVNKIRHKHEALQTGEYNYIFSNQGLDEHTQIFAYTRTTEKEKLLIVVNMDVRNEAGPAILYLDGSLGIDYSSKYKLKDLLTKKEYVRVGNELTVVLNPGQSHIFKVN